MNSLEFLTKFFKLFFKIKIISNKNKYWYSKYLYFISYIYIKNKIKYKKNFKEYKRFKYNIIILNFYNKQTRVDLKYFNKYNISFSVGVILKRYGIKEKFQKKSLRGEKIFFEYLNLYILKHYYLFTKINLSILKIKQITRRIRFPLKFIKLLLKRFKLDLIISQPFQPNNYKFNKKIKAIKKRLKKKNIKYENENI